MQGSWAAGRIVVWAGSPGGGPAAEAVVDKLLAATDGGAVPWKPASPVVLPDGSTAPAQLVRNTVNETCTSCHAEYRGPFLWEHQPVAEDCTNCHNPHGSVQPALLKLRPPFLCQTCHEGAGHPSMVNTPQGLAGGGAPSAFLLAGGCINCHSQIHGSNHPSGRAFMR